MRRLLTTREIVTLVTRNHRALRGSARVNRYMFAAVVRGLIVLGNDWSWPRILHGVAEIRIPSLKLNSQSFPKLYRHIKTLIQRLSNCNVSSKLCSSNNVRNINIYIGILAQSLIVIFRLYAVCAVSESCAWDRRTSWKVYDMYV